MLSNATPNSLILTLRFEPGHKPTVAGDIGLRVSNKTTTTPSYHKRKDADALELSVVTGLVNREFVDYVPDPEFPS